MKKISLLICFVLASTMACANSVAEYEARRQAYLIFNSSLSHDDNLIIQAYLGQQLNQDALNHALDDITQKNKADFHINTLVRTLFYTDDSKDKILKALEQQPFWLTQGESKHQYWSENHMLLWMSSAWLLHESFGLDVSDNTLHERLIHFLNIKIEYGFYEFFFAQLFPLCAFWFA